MTERAPIDPTRGLADVALGDVVELGDARAVWDRAEQVGQVMLAAEGLGTASRALEVGVAYAKERQAFGRAIGSYQAIKHSLVDAYVGVEQLRSLVWWAAWAADESPDELPLAAAAVKGLAATVVEQATETLIQVHGGIGFTWEHDAHLYWRRAKVDRLLLGRRRRAPTTRWPGWPSRHDAPPRRLADAHLEQVGDHPVAVVRGHLAHHRRAARPGHPGGRRAAGPGHRARTTGSSCS